METLVYRNSRLKYALFLLGTTGFVVASAFLIARGRPGDALMAWSSMVFFGAGIPLFLKQIVDRRPRLVINDDGIVDRTLGVGLIQWPEISGAYVRSIRSNDFICLQLHNPDLWVGKLAPRKWRLVAANLRMGFSELNLNLSGVAVKTDQLLNLVLSMSASHAVKLGES